MRNSDGMSRGKCSGGTEWDDKVISGERTVGCGMSDKEPAVGRGWVGEGVRVRTVLVAVWLIWITWFI